MLGLYHRLALRLRPFRALLAALLALAAGAFAWALFNPTPAAGGDDPVLMLTLVAALWCLLGWVVSAVFAAPARYPEPGERWLARVRKRLALGLRWLVALGFTGVSVAALVLTARLVPLAAGALYS